MPEAAWLALAAGMLSFSGMAIVVMIKAPWKRNSNAKLPTSCTAHSGFVAEQSAMHEDISEIKGDIKDIQTKQDTMIVTTTEIKTMLEMKK